MGESSSRKRRRARSRSRSRSPDRHRNSHRSRHSRRNRSRSDSRSRSRSRSRERHSGSRKERSEKRRHSRSHSRSRSRSRSVGRKERKEKRRRARSESRERRKREKTVEGVKPVDEGLIRGSTSAQELQPNGDDLQIPAAVVETVPSPEAATLAPAPALVVPEDNKQRGSTAEVAKKFQFGGIAIKSDKFRGGLKAPLRKSPAAAGETDEKKKRQEKLKLWREQQLKLKQEEAQQFLAEEDAAPKQLTLWSLDEEAKAETPDERRKREEQEELQRQRVQKVVEEVDPLDAYMAGLVDEAAIQQSIANPASNVISLDEIEAKAKINIYGTFLPQFSAEVSTPADEEDDVGVAEAPSAAVVNETAEEREAREERELQEFMRALKEQRERESSGGASVNGDANGKANEDSAKKDDTGRIYQGFEEDVIGEGAEHIDTRSALEILQEAQKKKEIKAVDHSQVRLSVGALLCCSPTGLAYLLLLLLLVRSSTFRSRRSSTWFRRRSRTCPKPKWRRSATKTRSRSAARAALARSRSGRSAASACACCSCSRSTGTQSRSLSSVRRSQRSCLAAM